MNIIFRQNYRHRQSIESHRVNWLNSLLPAINPRAGLSDPPNKVNLSHTTENE